MKAGATSKLPAGDVLAATPLWTVAEVAAPAPRVIMVEFTHVPVKRFARATTKPLDPASVTPDAFVLDISKLVIGEVTVPLLVKVWAFADVKINLT